MQVAECGGAGAPALKNARGRWPPANTASDGWRGMADTWPPGQVGVRPV